MKKAIVVTCALCAMVVLPMVAQARVEFTEVMYDPSGTDAGREWVEIHNTASDSVDISVLKLFEEGVNHGLKAAVGSGMLGAGQYAVIADDPTKFSADWPGYSGAVFDSSFSLKNGGEVLVLRGKDADEDSFAFDPTLGAAGDGNSLQKQLSADGLVSWVAVSPTPGAVFAPSVAATTNVSTTNGSTTSSPQNATTSQDDTVDTAASPSVVESTNASVVLASNTSSVVSSVTAAAKYIPVEPQIFCKISGKGELLAGIEATFSAQSWGLKKQPLQNARYVWNFGDGQTKEGQYVLHTYMQPGTYELFLETASDVYSAIDRLRVTVHLPQLALSHSADTLVIENQGAESIDLFGLKVSQAARPDFVFPEHSMVSGRATMTIDATLFSRTYAEVLRADELPITLQYLNGRVVATSSMREVHREAAVQSMRVQSSAPAPAPTTKSKSVAKPKPAANAAKTIVFASTSDQVIVLDTTAKERQLQYYGATVGVLALLAFAWWYLLR